MSMKTRVLIPYVCVVRDDRWTVDLRFKRFPSNLGGGP